MNLALAIASASLGLFGLLLLADRVATSARFRRMSRELRERGRR